MATYRLQSLLRIRANREDKASAALAVARQAVAEALNAVHTRERELADFQATAEARRDRIYAAVMNRPVTMDELDRAREGIARIDDEGVLRADNVLLAKKALDERRSEESKARAQFVLATKDRMKISEHRTRWAQDEVRAQEHFQELELEDFTGKKNTDVD
ncbi:MAG: YscO family type III secretion system apparatus protein [Candidatus Spyradenecus sp.]